MVICVNSDFQQHHMESQMCSQQWPYQDKFWFPLCPAAIPLLLLFLFPYPHPLPSVLSLSLSCLCFACRSEVSRGCCIHFQFPLCGGIPLVITFSFPTLAPCAKFEQLGPEFSKTVTRHRVPTRTPIWPWICFTIKILRTRTQIKQPRLLVCLLRHTNALFSLLLR